MASLGFVSSQGITIRPQIPDAIVEENTTTTQQIVARSSHVAFTLVYLFGAVVVCSQLICVFLDVKVPIWILSISISTLLLVYALRCDNVSSVSFPLSRYVFYVYFPMQIVIFHYLGILYNSAIAFLISPLIFPFIFVLNEHKMVKYDISKPTWILSRMNFYAFLRGVSAYLVTLGMHTEFDKIFVFCIGTLETLLMYTFSNQSYSFSVTSSTFLAYAVIKSSVLLSMPEIESYILQSS